MSDDCVRRNFQFRRTTQKDPVQVERFAILKKFVAAEKSSISLGCGSYEPLLIKTTDALDNSMLSANYLAEQGFSGKFIFGDVRALPLPDKSYELAVCSEVIEHQPTTNDIKMIFNEINRIAKIWLISTPAGFSPDPEHVFHFTESQLRELLPWPAIKIYKKGFFFYISNDERRLSQCLS